MRGPLFENMIIAVFIKQRFNQFLPSNLYFWRDKTGHEIDILMEYSNHISAIEIKSGETITSDYFNNLTANQTKTQVIYNGDHTQNRYSIAVTPWQQCIDCT